MSTETKAELEAKLAALQAELAEINRKLAEVPALEKRKAELCDGWHHTGEISATKRKLTEVSCPIYKTAHSGMIQRIHAVDSKWITLVWDGGFYGDASRYRRSDGGREGTRKGGETIDVAKALAIWERTRKDSRYEPSELAAW